MEDLDLVHTTTFASVKAPMMAPTTVSSSSHDTGALSSDEIAAIKRFVSQLDHSSMVPISSFAHSSTTASALSTLLTDPQSTWIIDSRVSHHITGMSSLFTSYKVCIGQDKVHIVDGSLSFIPGQGDIPTTPDICLSSILHVPNFTLNLLSISHLTSLLTVVSPFFLPIVCFRTWRRRERLVWDMRIMVSMDSTSLVATSAIMRNVTSFTPYELSLLDGYCEPCQLAKHFRTTYPVSNDKKSSIHFSIVHSDVWSLAPPTSLSGFKYFVTFVDNCSRTT